MTFADVADRIASVDLGETPEAMRSGFARLLRSDAVGDASISGRLERRGVDGLWIAPEADTGHPDTCLVWFHGGGYVFGAPETHARAAAAFSEQAAMPVFLPRYRLAPEHRWPAQLEDALAVVKAVQEAGSRVVLAGDSAGGHLALVTALARAREERPVAALVLFSPNTDRSGRSTTRVANTPRDPMNADADDARLARIVFGDDFDPADPQVSPLLDDLVLLPPTYIEVGAREVLLDDARMLAERGQAAGAPVTIHIAAGAFHMWQLWTPWLPDATASLARAATFLHALR